MPSNGKDTTNPRKREPPGACCLPGPLPGIGSATDADTREYNRSVGQNVHWVIGVTGGNDTTANVALDEC